MTTNTVLSWNLEGFGTGQLDACSTVASLRRRSGDRHTSPFWAAFWGEVPHGLPTDEKEGVPCLPVRSSRVEVRSRWEAAGGMDRGRSSTAPGAHATGTKHDRGREPLGDKGNPVCPVQSRRPVFGGCRSALGFPAGLDIGRRLPGGGRMSRSARRGTRPRPPAKARWAPSRQRDDEMHPPVVDGWPTAPASALSAVRTLRGPHTARHTRRGPHTARSTHGAEFKSSSAR